MSTSIQIEQVKRLLLKGQFSTAIDQCLQLLSVNPIFVDIHILLSQAYQQNTQFDKMLASARSAHELQPQYFSTNTRLIECLIYTGEIADAIKKLDFLHQHIESSAPKLAKVSELYLHCSQFYKVEHCLLQAHTLEANNPQYLLNLASASITLGKFEYAQDLLNIVIKLTPADFDAYYNRSTLTRQTVSSNHIQQLQQILELNQSKPNARIALGYALAKEFEDLSDAHNSFKYLELGAKTRRQQLSYKVDNDIRTLDLIKTVFSAHKLNRASASNSTESPVFILGLPRSGSTLLERMLSTHSAVGSLGEVNQLAFSIMHSVGPNSGKTDLIEKSIAVDFDQLAQRYSHACKGYGISGKLLIDKTPLNFLYLGLIKLAFPKAKIIHLKRHQLDACYAIYKTLFRMGYPFSYDLKDLGSYYIAYHQLMEHWRTVFEDDFFDLDYEALVQQPEQQARNVLEYCQLPWEADVLEFHQQKSTTATASAAQVRQPVYTSSVERWKTYAQQLEPLRNQLAAAGIACD